VSSLDPEGAAAPPAQPAGNRKLWKFLKILSIIFLIFWGTYFLYLVVDPKHLHPEYRLNAWSTLLLSFVQLIRWFVAIALIYTVIYTQVLRKK
jgi:hypothetical protein